MTEEKNQLTPEKRQEQIKNLKSWIEPKETQVHAIEQAIETKELAIKHIEDNIKGGWYLKQANKNIKEARTDLERKRAEFQLEQTKVDLEKGFLGREDKLMLEDLQMQLKIEKDAVEGIKKKITMLQRNHNLDEGRTEEKL